ncbi:MAG: DUF350 domain-containing protein [Candidatus Dormibacteraeota bacterium]|uniref:DUF350 domain-containing protein n=1 Tax=Candidatus Dormiibacter inghamiae TaxID=3127013 RepID=A0A934N659_9BACT|nr:DUF350 domain-containing protein [Candidatus Dormibacteraeota bacterium]MBJ7605528.1 DUF350 domain-containing protein [Candidatus Dormibacteraeota bacterium]PZR66868.1 MAG: DUF350 domain-containing protein [Candidatus Dormibacteraeota bacterium]
MASALSLTAQLAAALLATTTQWPWSLLNGVLALVGYAVLGTLLLLLGYLALDLVTPGKLGQVIRTEHNANAAVLAASGVLGLSFLIAAAIFTSGGDLLQGLIETLVFGLVGILAQAAALFAFDRVIGVDAEELMGQRHLLPATILAATVRIGIGLITAYALI